jgi:tetratricopeptide (TPR) repeat protein
MARAAVKAKQQAKAKAQPAKASHRGGGRRRHASGGNPNQQLFFTRMRRSAKPVYLILAALFAATFVALGVGSGTNSGLDQIFSGLFGGSSATSVSGAQKEVAKNPVKGYQDLANAYQAKNDLAGAVSALQSLTGLRKKDAGAWAQLGGLQVQQAQQFAAQYQTAAAAQQAAEPSSAFLPTGSLGSAIGSNPLEQVAAQQTSSVTSTFYQSAVSAYQSALTAYKQVAKLRPKDANAQFQLATTAQNAGQTAVAVAAYKQYLKLNPTSPQRAQIEKVIKALAPTKPKTTTKNGG